MEAESTVTARVEGDEIVIRIPRSEPRIVAAEDRLIHVHAIALGELGLEYDGVKALIDEGKLPVAKIGRKHHVRMSDLLALAKPRTPSVRKAAPPVAPTRTDAETQYFETRARMKARAKG